MKYVVISCWEREIYKVGEADTPNEAIEIMKADFMNKFSHNFNNNEKAEFAFNNGYGKCDYWDCNIIEAWLNSCRGNYDWKIIEVNN